MGRTAALPPTANPVELVENERDGGKSINQSISK